ncbi:MAG: hypothetical protein AB8G11_26360 [Saprospiraceae bacterium]
MTMTELIKTREEFAYEYQVAPRTFRRWLKNDGIKLPRGYITPKYQQLIYETFGNPNDKKKATS